MPRVSVAIPTYNASTTIEATLRSVLDSTFDDLEIIVTDDASTDDTLQIVEAVDDPRIRWVRNPQTLGAPANWNRALGKANGEFVGLLNHDDLYGPFWLAFAVHALENHPPIGWVATAYRIIDEKGHVKGAIKRFDETGAIDRETAFLQIARLDGLGPVYLARREVIEALGGYDEEIGASADNDLFLRLASRYPLYYSCNPHHAAWRSHPGNLTHRWPTVDQAIEGLKTLSKAFEDDAMPPRLKRHKASCYTYFYQKTLDRARELLASDQIETAQYIVEVLYKLGYKT